MKKFSAVLISASIFFVIGLLGLSPSAYAFPCTGADDGGTPTPIGCDSGGGNPPIGGGNPPVSVSAELKNPFSGGDSLSALMKAIVDKVILPIGGVLAVLAFIYSGFLYVTAQGNETRIKDAHKALLYTAIGTAVLLGSWVLATVICNTISKLNGTLVCPS